MVLRAAILIGTMLTASAATAQTLNKAQCGQVVGTVAPVITSMADASRAMKSLDWKGMQDFTSGTMRAAAAKASIAQAKAVQALEEYKASIEDFAYEARKCAAR